MSISPYAGKPVDPWMLTNIPRLVTACYVNRPDPAVPTQRVAFGTSGHCGSSLVHAFNEAHILTTIQNLKK
jgi:phosphoglucomutase